jgi:hypothetical protein
MKRRFLTLVFAGIAGSLFLVGDAQACHKRKCGCAPAAAPCVVAEPAPCPPPAPVCETSCAPRKKCGLGLFACFKGFKLGCHRKAACGGPAPCGETVAYSGPVSYSAPAVYAAPQASVQH